MDTPSATNSGSGRRHCPDCGANDWVRDQSDIDRIKLHTDPQSKPGNLGCNSCGHSWTPDATD